MFDQATLVTLGFLLILSGFAVTFLAALLLLLRSIRGRGRTRGAGIIMIGPIPVILGTDKETIKILLVLSIVLIVVFSVLMLLPRIIH